MPEESRDPVATEVLDEQLAYYRARAPEYDRWFNREGRFDRGAEWTAAWRAELDEVRAHLDSVGFEGMDVLELAAGTGLWTAELLARGARVTAVDAAPEMLAQLAARVGEGRVTVLEADLFAWSPPRAFDAVVSCFFMSHVPDERFVGFAALLASAVPSGGRVVLLDSLREPTSTATDHVLPDEVTQTMTRRLDDGRDYTIVKRFRRADELVALLADEGIDARVHETERYFQLALGVRR